MFNNNEALSVESQKLIGNAVWNLGGCNPYSTPTSCYIQERSYKDSFVARTVTNKVGLLYASDFGLASGGSTRTSCLLNSGDSLSGCSIYVGLNSKQNDVWLISAYYNYPEPLYIDVDNFRGDLPPAGRYYSPDSSDYTHTIFPVVYLKANVAYAGGYGTAYDPYRIK